MSINSYESLWKALVHNEKGEDFVQELYHKDLRDKLLKDMKRVGIPTNFNLVLKPYSKTFFGRYDPNTNKVILYVYDNPDCSKMCRYDTLLLTLIHESIHSIQWNDSSFVRRKGVMHDAEFHKLYNFYSDKAKSYMLLEEVRKSADKNKGAFPKAVKIYS